MLHFTFHRVLSTLLVCFLFLSTSCYATPTPYALSKIIHRQDGSSGVQTVTTTQPVLTMAGKFIETCTIVMTPITGDNGESLVREERSCTLSMDSSSGSGGGVVSSEPPVTFTSTVATSGVSSRPSAAPPAGVSVEGLSSVPNPEPSGSPSYMQPDGSSTVTPSSSFGTPVSSPDASAVGAVAESATETPFDPPGKQIQVLPIGLGIFAGISVIAIIIVGIVTYERMKHRKNFRRRKLAEAGASMGSGGMAQVA